MPLPIREFIWVYSFILSIFKVRMIGWFLFKVNCEDHHVSCGFELFKMLDPLLFWSPPINLCVLQSSFILEIWLKKISNPVGQEIWK